MSTRHVKLTIEKGEGGMLWGRTIYKRTEYIQEGETVEDVEELIRKQIRLGEQVDVQHIRLDKQFDLYSFFKAMPFLNISQVAELLGMSDALLRQYISGAKKPSDKRLFEIQKGIRSLAEQMVKVDLVQPSDDSMTSKKKYKLKLQPTIEAKQKPVMSTEDVKEFVEYERDLFAAFRAGGRGVPAAPKTYRGSNSKDDY